MSAERRFVTDEEERYLRAQPRVITPSNIYHWDGTYLAEDARFTRNQLYRLRERGLDPATVETIQVNAAVPPTMLSMPSWQKAPIRRLLCPVVGRRGERVLVISPSGHDERVWSDGSLTRRKKRIAAYNAGSADRG